MPASEKNRLYKFGRGIGDAFSTQPIVGVANQALWFPREALERDLSYSLGNETQHICVDGPSGTGKTSLAQHVLVSQQAAFISIQIFQDMTWADFCKNFVEIPKRSKETKAFTAKGALSIFRGPSASAELKHTEEYSEKDNLDLLLTTASSWTPSDVGNWLDRNQMILIVDDLEHASQELNMRLASLCKLMGQSSQGKVILVGTDDVMMRVIAENPSLSGRITEVTVGGLGSPSESANFLMRKFNNLDIRTPFTTKGILKSEKDKVTNDIYDAANGLMKELNELGSRLGREVSVSGNLSAKAIAKICHAIVREKRWSTRSEMNSLLRVAQSSVDIREVMTLLASKGASAITYVDEIQNDLQNAWNDDQIQSALDIMANQDVITVTGSTRKRVFFKNPTLLNAILTETRNKSDQQISLGLIGGGKSPVIELKK